MKSVHSVLNKEDWDLNELRNALELDRSSINTLNKKGKSPLVRLLEHDNCSIEAVKLLISNGANVNYCTTESTPLCSALFYCRGEPIIRLLLNAGANPNKLLHASSPMCIALARNTIDVVKLFFNKECNLNACRWHDSVLHCCISSSSKSSLEALSLLLKTHGSLVNRLDKYGRHILCIALSGGAEAAHIELLLQAGVSCNACTKHASPFHCAVSGTFVRKFNASVVNVLLKAGACPYAVDDNGQTALQLALKNCKYEPKAIEYLLYHLGEHPTAKVNDDYLLHYAVSNGDCKLSVLKWLISLGAAIEKVDKEGNTPLHLSVQHCPRRIINYLLDMGSPANLKNNRNETVLLLAVTSKRDPEILADVYVASSRMANRVIGTHTFELMKNASFQEETKACMEMLTKFCFLENPDCDIEQWIRDEIDYRDGGYAQQCGNELQNLEQYYGASLRSYIRGYSVAPNGEPEAATYDLDQLLKIRPDIQFPIFFDIFAARVGRPVMEMKLNTVNVYAFKKCSAKVFLNNETKSQLIRYLSDADKLSLIIAYFNPANLT